MYDIFISFILFLLLDNIIGEEGMKILCDSLGNMRKLSHLNVRSNIIGDEGITSLCNVMKNLTNLLYLDIGCINNIYKFIILIII